jgi:hypothetical protein
MKQNSDLMTMKKYINVLMLLCFLFPVWTTIQAQNEKPDEEQIPRDPKAREKIEAARIGIITNKLGLTPEQAEKFWPIYHEFAEKRIELRKEFRSEQEKIKPDQASQEQKQRLVELGLNLKQKELDLEKIYSGKLLNVISADQMLNLRTAERDFQRMLMNQLQQRREIQQRRENFRERNQNLRDRKN